MKGNLKIDKVVEKLNQNYDLSWWFPLSTIVNDPETNLEEKLLIVDIPVGRSSGLVYQYQLYWSPANSITNISLENFNNSTYL